LTGEFSQADLLQRSLHTLVSISTTLQTQAILDVIEHIAVQQHRSLKNGRHFAAHLEGYIAARLEAFL
jgi:hypothetical protein